MAFEFKGFDKLTDQLEGVMDTVKNFDGKSLPLNEILTDEFMEKNTVFSSLDSFLKKSGLNINTSETFEKISDVALDKFVSQNSKFENWPEMFKKAAGEFAAKKFK